MFVFGWLRRLFGFGGTSRAGVFRVDLHDGPKWFDPSSVRAKLNAVYPEWAESVDFITLATKPMPAAVAKEAGAVARLMATAEEKARAIAAACSVAFNMPALDESGKGYSEAERLKTLAGFLDYCAKLLERTRPLANAPAGSESVGAN